MEAPVEFEDWEVLQGPEALAAAPINAAQVHGNAFEGVDSDDGIRADYFSPDSDPRQAESFCLDQQVIHSDSDRPSWVDPVELNGKLAGGEFWTSDESCDEHTSPRERERFDLFLGEPSKLVIGFGDGGGLGESHEGEEKFPVDGSAVGDGEKVGDKSDETSAGGKNSDGGSAANLANKGVVWWKLPVELLRFCVIKVRPIWPISVAAALLGFVMLRRKLHATRRRSRNLPLKVCIDDKKASLFAVQAARLNEAFSVVKRMPILKPHLPPTGATPWPVLALR